MELDKNDYQEPCCVLKKPHAVTPIPVGRVLEKLDSYWDQNDPTAVERHLAYWVTEAEASGDLRGKLTLVNEQIGLFRKTGREEEALAAIETAVALLGELALEDTLIMATTFINAATAYRAFDKPEQALPLYERAATIYEAHLEPDDARLGGLYNNTALTVAALGEYGRAEALYQKALAVMTCVEHGEAECAITWCNLADLAAATLGMEAAEERIALCLEKAKALLDTPGLPHNGYHAFVCEKCAPTFGYYGYFLIEQELKTRAERIYEGNRTGEKLL